MKIIMLIENTTGNTELHSEHGLSIYIEASGHKLLFDAGQTDAFVENAKLLGVDLAQVDIAILSHGHYDHSGGFEKFLEVNKKANIYVNENAFATFISGKEKKIGIPEFLSDNERVIVTKDYTKLDLGLELFTCNEKERRYQSDSGELYIQQQEGKELDTFSHEQYLLITEGEEKILISGCSHKGILNITEWFQPDVLIGGFHFKGIEMNEVGKQRLDNYGGILGGFKTKFYTCHCTGVAQYEYLKEMMNKQVEYLKTGDEIVR